MKHVSIKIVALILFIFTGIQSGFAAAPQVNYMDCNNTMGRTAQENGKIGCYGVWDYGNSFGGDKNMCQKSIYGKSTKGCIIETQTCKSGYASATRRFTPANLDINGRKLRVLAKNLKTDIYTLRDEMVTVWEYTCMENPETAKKSTHRVYMNGRLAIRTNNITKADSLANCKLNARNNTSANIVCIWNNQVILTR